MAVLQEQFSLYQSTVFTHLPKVAIERAQYHRHCFKAFDLWLLRFLDWSVDTSMLDQPRCGVIQPCITQGSPSALTFSLALRLAQNASLRTPQRR